MSESVNKPQRTVLVTGGGRGTAAAQSMVARIRGEGGVAMACQADVSDESQLLAMFATIDAEMPPLGALVNNAGVVDVQSRVDVMTVQRLQRMFAINVLGSIICAREAIKRMSTKHGGQGGTIVNLSSAAARIGAPGQYVDYAAAKGAIDVFTMGLAKEVAAGGIGVTGVRPG